MSQSITKRLFPAALAAILTASAASAAETHQKVFSIYGAYTSNNRSAIAGLNLSYRMSEYVRLAPSVDYTFRHHGIDAYNISLDYQLPLRLTATSDVNFYPLAGIGYTAWTRKMEAGTVRTESSERTNRFGFNVGGGLEFFSTPTMRLGVEATWRYRKGYSTGVFSVSIGYVF
ncbi:MAG: outer membrane beta-barrel protein [Muribaculaceae bacterium]|nr:outer membrane beta-barrel protein [Muribaculaceae bacterium]